MMTEATAAEIQEFILSGLDDPLRAKGLTRANVPAAFDLLLEGMIDSFGVVELIATLEERYGLEFDLDELDTDDLTRVGPLSEYVARKLNGT
jgi:acyl carrier protein